MRGATAGRKALPTTSAPHLSLRRVPVVTPSSTYVKGQGNRVGVRLEDGRSLRRDGGGISPLLGHLIKSRYRVIRKLGAGRLGTVFLAEELATAKKVAVKVFHRKFSKDQDFADQLQRQAKSAMALCEKHPRIASVYDCDRTNDGSAFIVMEYLDGTSLQDVIRRQSPLEIERVLRLASQIAEGLEAAHDLGFVHTDVRPQNVVLVMEGQEETIKLKGFETAGLIEAGLAGHFTRAGLLTGNPEYSAPEQIEGGEGTPRTDIYALGVILYEMLSGTVPFRASAPDGVLAKHIQEIPPSPKALRPEIPSVVALKVMQALEKEPEKRHRYIADVANEYLLELAVDELATERARRKYGVFWKLVVAVQAYFAGARDIDADEEQPGRRWKIVAIAAILLLILVPAAWILISRQVGTVQSTPPLQQPRTELPAVEVVENSGKTDVAEQPAPPLPVETPEEASDTRERLLDGPKETPEPASAAPSSPGRTSLRPPETKSAFQKKAPRAEPREAQAQRPRTDADLTRTSKAPPAPRKEGARQESDSPDPTAIIDWLLKRPLGKD
jgi:hypothetical protein